MPHADSVKTISLSPELDCTAGPAAERPMGKRAALALMLGLSATGWGMIAAVAGVLAF